LVVAGLLEADDEWLSSAVDRLVANDVDLLVTAGFLEADGVVLVATVVLLVADGVRLLFAAGFLETDDVRVLVAAGFLEADDVRLLFAAGLLEADGVSPKSHVVVLVEDARDDSPTWSARRRARVSAPSRRAETTISSPQCISRPNPDFPSRGDDDLEEV